MIDEALRQALAAQYHVATIDGHTIGVREPMFLSLRHAGIVVESGGSIVTSRTRGELDADMYARPHLMVCDFCSEQGVTYSYPARDFQMRTNDGAPIVDHGREQWSFGAWCACQECHKLVKATKRDKLLARSVDVIVGRLGLRDAHRRSARLKVAREVRKAHDEFWSHRDGASSPIRVVDL